MLRALTCSFGDITCILLVSCAHIAGRAWRAAKRLPYSMQLPIPSGQSTYQSIHSSCAVYNERV
jgi:hypothetical protein